MYRFYPDLTLLDLTPSNSTKLQLTWLDSIWLNQTQSDSNRPNPTQPDSNRLNLTWPDSIWLNQIQADLTRLILTQTNSTRLHTLKLRFLYLGRYNFMLTGCVALSVQPALADLAVLRSLSTKNCVYPSKQIVTLLWSFSIAMLNIDLDRNSEPMFKSLKFPRVT